MAKPPTTLLEAIRYFGDPDVALDFAAKLRWPEGPVCPRCTCPDVSCLKTRRLWKCKECSKQFSVKVGTIFEDSPIGLDKWLPAIWMMVNCKNGISSYELSRALGVTQKTAWFMEHRIRLALQSATFKKLSGHVEADETFIGGKARNMHPGKRKVQGRGAVGKAAVMGLLERHGKAVVEVVPDNRKGTVQGKVRAAVLPGANVYTDALRSYEGLAAEYIHEVIDHAETYVDGQIHTNGMENFWSLLKRTLNGTYVSVEPYHLFRYLDEQAFRFNNREGGDGERFVEALRDAPGRRLTWKQAVGQA